MIITIITPTYNREKWLAETLASVLRQDTCGAEVEYLVVDNKSTDGTKKVVETYAAQSRTISVRYLFESTAGVNRARNAGVAQAKGDFIIFFDDDLLLEDGVLAAYIRAFQNFPHSEVFGGRISIRPPEFVLPEWLVLDGPYARTMIVLRMEHGTTTEVRAISEEDMPVGPSMAFKRSVFERCGVFRTDFGLVGGSLVPGAEYELLLRLRSMGIREWVYVGEARVLHPIKPSQANKPYFRRRMFGVGIVLKRLHPMPARWKIFGLPVYVPGFVVRNFIKSVKFGVSRRRVEAFYYQCQSILFCGYIYQHFRKEPTRKAV